jgi:hypothetical protein
MPWKPGETGNPGGRAKTKLFQQALRNVLSLSEAETIAKTVVRMAKLGDLHAVNIIADRLDGKPHQSVEVTDERTDDLTALFDQMLASAAPTTEESGSSAKDRSRKAARK